MSVRILVVWLLCTLFQGRQTFAQTKAIDSLRLAYKTSTSDTGKILILTELAFHVNHQNPDSALVIAKRALAQSERTNYEMGIAKSLLTLSYVYTSKEKYLIAIEYANRSQSMYKKLNNKKGIMLTEFSIGQVLALLGSYPLSTEYFLRGKVLSEEIHDKKGTGIALVSLGNLHESQNEPQKALKYYLEGMANAEERKDSLRMAFCLNNIGLVYSKEKNFTKALTNFKIAKNIFEKFSDKKNASYCVNNMADVYEEQGKDAQALALYHTSLEVKESVLDMRGATYSLNGIARIYQKQNQLEKSILYAKKGLQIARKIGALREVKMTSYTLYDTYKEKGDAASALTYFELLSKISDSLFSIDKAKIFANLEAKAELEMKDKEIEQLNSIQEILKKEKEQKNIIIYLVIFILAITFAYLLHVYRGWWKEKAAKKLILEQKVEIETLNDNLENLVMQRTKALEARGKQLEEYAFFNAHVLRAPVATILGLFNIYKFEKNAKGKELILNHLHESVKELERVVGEIQHIVSQQDTESINQE
jgi:tetratricopeptide (TPR) repeat protein